MYNLHIYMYNPCRCKHVQSPTRRECPTPLLVCARRFECAHDALLTIWNASRFEMLLFLLDESRYQKALQPKAECDTRPWALQGYLAHKKCPPPPRTTIGPWAYAYCRVLGGVGFL